MNEQNREDEYYERIQPSPQYVSTMQKENRQGLIIAITIVFALFMVVAATLVIFALRKELQVKFSLDVGQEQDAEGAMETVPFIDSLPLPDEEEGEPLDGEELEEWEKHLICYSEADNPFLAKDYKSHMGTNHNNYLRSEFTDEYYAYVCDSISEEVPYRISRKYYTYAAAESNTQIHVSCVSLDGDLINLEALNKAIYDKTMFLAKVYLENYQDYASTKGINIMVDSYVTYNDESKLSIVLDEYYIIEQDVNIDLYCINVDLDSGMILNNAKILNYNESFAKEFREKSGRQNGVDTALNDMAVSDILGLLSDEYNNIIFYTPLGMELGINYVLGGNSGWITVTYSDYEKYVNSL